MSTQEQFLARTHTALECVQEVRMRVPEADGMTWTLNDKDCWAKSGTINSTIDPNGCAYCKSCIFGKFIFHTHIHAGLKVSIAVLLDIYFILYIYAQLTVAGEKPNFLSATLFVDQEQNGK